MNKVEDILILQEELENLREKLNKYVVKNINDTSEEEYKNILDISIKLDRVIADYIKSVKK